MIREEYILMEGHCLFFSFNSILSFYSDLLFPISCLSRPLSFILSTPLLAT